MFAIVETGGKQYKVQENTVFIVEKLEAEIGTKIVLDKVLAVGPEPMAFGEPFISNANVEVEVINQQKADKIIVFKKKRRQNYRRKNGHRQLETVLKVVKISV
jgi:large subunit ribosomal protein L21